MSAPATAITTGPSVEERAKAILKEDESLFSTIGILSKKNGTLQRNTNTKISDEDILAFQEWYATASANNAEPTAPCHPGVLRILKLWKARMSASIDNARVSNSTRGTAKITKDVLDKWIRAGEAAPPETCAMALGPTNSTRAVVGGPKERVCFDPARILAKLEELEKLKAAAPAVASMVRNANSVRSAEELQSVLEGIETALENQPAELKQEVASAIQALKDPMDAKLDALKTALEAVKAEMLAAVKDIPALQTNIESRFSAMGAAATKEEIQAIVSALQKDLGQEHIDMIEKLEKILKDDIAKTANVTETREALQAELKEIRSDLSDIKNAISTDVLRDRFQSQLDKLTALQAASAAPAGEGTGPLTESIASLQSILDALSKKVSAEDAAEATEEEAALRAARDEIAQLRASLQAKQAEMQAAQAAKTANNSKHAEELAGLTAQIEAKVAELEGLRAAAQTSPNAKQSIATLESAVSERNARITALEAELEGLRKQSEEVRVRESEEAAAAAVAAVTERLTAERAALEANLTETKAQLEAERAKSERDAARIAELERTLAECNRLREQIESDLATLEQNKEAVARVEENRAGRNAEYAKEIETLTAKLAETQSRLKAREDRNATNAALEKVFRESTAAELERAHAAAAAAESRRAECETAAAATQAELTALRRELEEAKGRAEAAEVKLASVKPEMLGVQTDLTQTQTALKDTQTKLEGAEKGVKNRDAYYSKIHPKLMQYGVETFSPEKDYTVAAKPSLTASSGASAASGRFAGIGAPSAVRGKGTSLPSIAEGATRPRKSRRAAAYENSRRRTRRHSRRTL